MRLVMMLALCLITVSVFAQEGALHADFRREGERVSEACKFSGAKALPGCAIQLFTDHPLHVAAGSMPPQNGFALGGAFVAGKNTKNWRMTWDIDAVGSMNKSFRAGGYMKLIHTPPQEIHVLEPRPSGTVTAESQTGTKVPSLVRPYTVVNLYAQAISLNKMYYFGLGNNSTILGQSAFGMRENIVGASVIKPVYAWDPIRPLNVSLIGEINGRFVSLRGNQSQSVPSIETRYTDATAPGLLSQPAMVQFREGVRLKPDIGGHVQLNYLATFQQYAASSDSHHSFVRWTTDLDHTVSLYGHTQSGTRSNDVHGPDECAKLDERCPSVSYSRNLNGSIGVRLLVSESLTSLTNTVPFYFQPTLGGSDIDGASALASFQDYRFRAPNILLLRETFEHSIWGPLGLGFMADQGKVGFTHNEIGFDHLKHSFAAGLTLRAGGFPMVSLLFAWGGGEGHHNIFNLNSSLIGGSARPSLF
jgi:hypothetical protein